MPHEREVVLDTPLPAGWDAGLPTGVLQGRTACRQQLLQLLLALGGLPETDKTAETVDPAKPVPAAWAFPAVPREVWLCDAQFAHWPLDDAGMLAALARWLRPHGRRLRLLGLDFESVARSFPRFARWRRHWAHRIDCWAPQDAELLPGLRGLLAGPVVAQWLDAPDPRLLLLTDPAQVRAFAEQNAAFLQRCEPAWPVTTLGL